MFHHWEFKVFVSPIDDKFLITKMFPTGGTWVAFSRDGGISWNENLPFYKSLLGKFILKISFSNYNKYSFYYSTLEHDLVLYKTKFESNKFLDNSIFKLNSLNLNESSCLASFTLNESNEDIIYIVNVFYNAESRISKFNLFQTKISGKTRNLLTNFELNGYIRDIYLKSPYLDFSLLYFLIFEANKIN
ncbi:MAG: hypothetical protein ACP5KX_01000 [Caldisericia bacterium]